MYTSIASSSDGEKPSAPKDPIDENLKRVYDRLIEDEVPDRFAELLRKLREQEGRK